MRGVGDPFDPERPGPDRPGPERPDLQGVADLALPVDRARLGPGQVVVDLVYDPLRTALLVAAAEPGATAVGGIGMLVHQAAAAFRLWTGLEAPLGAMKAAVLAELAAREARPPL
jgi:shikimate 5-dehydrogenase